MLGFDKSFPFGLLYIFFVTEFLEMYIQVNFAISKSKGMAKYFELSEVRHKQNVMSPQYDVHVQFLQYILLKYMCIQTVPIETLIKMKTKEIHFS